MGIGESSKIIAGQWKQLSEEEKKIYQDKADADKNQKLVQKKNYEA